MGTLKQKCGCEQLFIYFNMRHIVTFTSTGLDNFTNVPYNFTAHFMKTGN